MRGMRNIVTSYAVDTGRATEIGATKKKSLTISEDRSLALYITLWYSWSAGLIVPLWLGLRQSLSGAARHSALALVLAAKPPKPAPNIFFGGGFAAPEPPPRRL